jgi:hypothetical protein
MLISEYYKPNDGSAQVRQNPKTKEYFIIYFAEDGQIFDSEKFPDKSLRYVEDAAENYALGIKIL